MEHVRHTGSCHCGAIHFEVWASPILQVINCNCSICIKKQNQHFIVPAADFNLLTGHDKISTYTFGTHKAKHTFCSICGVQSFYTPRSNQDGVGVMPHCIDSKTVLKFEVETFDGSQWEDAMKNHPNILCRSQKESPKHSASEGL